MDLIEDIDKGRTDKGSMEKIVSLCKRRGFVWQSSDIYGGFAGFWDYGPLGAELVHNIKQLWWNHFVKSHEEMYGLASTVLMPEAVWRASSHLEGFVDPEVQCKKCKKRFRADQFEDKKNKCPECGGVFGDARQFNLMFKTQVGAVESEENNAYLRPEIAQGMFVHFKNVLDTMHPTLPFGIAQIGKSFRNEIAPRDFLFRVREFDLMEFEYFVRESEWKKHFERWRKEMWAWIEKVGIDKKKVHELEVSQENRAHYSKRTTDFEFEYSFGQKELYGLAYRGDYDLARHAKSSGVDLRYSDPVSGEKFIPHVVEPTFGVGRTLLAVLLSAYREEKDRIVLSLAPKLAPYTVAVFPLLANKPQLVEKARGIYSELRKHFAVAWDDRGNIGKRYYSQDEIGTPWCVTVDFKTLEREDVTVRDRDSAKQERVVIVELPMYFEEKLK